MTLEALTEYSRVVPRAVLSLDISIRYSRKGLLGKVHLSQSRPVATPIQVRPRRWRRSLSCSRLWCNRLCPPQVTKDDDIIVSTGYGRGVSSVKVGVANGSV